MSKVLYKKKLEAEAAAKKKAEADELAAAQKKLKDMLAGKADIEESPEKEMSKSS